LVLKIQAGASNIYANVFPNPSNNVVNIELKNYSGIAVVTIIRYNGQVSMVKHMDKLNSLPLSIDISQLGKGIYTIVIQSDNNRCITKFLKL
jgi:hypothetical protein